MRLDLWVRALGKAMSLAIKIHFHMFLPKNLSGNHGTGSSF
jgi:hypothetical protein